jgi:hypothetical protein
MVDPNRGEDKLDPAQVAFLARLVGVELGEARAAALAVQAEPHFALLRTLDGLGARGAEPAAEFRLDQWRRAGDA